MKVFRWLTKNKIPLSMGGAIVFFLFTVYQYAHKERIEALARLSNEQAQVETRRVEATKPFLEKQLTLYADVTQAAATLALKWRMDSDQARPAMDRFWRLYLGELALVEDTKVRAAMWAFGKALNDYDTPPRTLAKLAQELAGACRESLVRSWGVKELDTFKSIPDSEPLLLPNTGG